MKLSPHEAGVIAATELNVYRPLEEVARELGIKPYTARYHYRRLVDRGIIAPAPLINSYRAGFLDFTFLFSLASTPGEKDREQFISLLCAAPEVSWVGELGGRYHYGVSILSKSVAEVQEYWSKLVRKTGCVFFEKAMALRSGSMFFGKKYLDVKRLKRSMLEYTSQGKVVELDALDQRILIGLARCDYASFGELARRIQVPGATLDRRMKKLKADGILVGFINNSSVAIAGMQQYKVLVSSKSMGAEVRKLLVPFCQQHKHVTHLIEGIGQWDFEVGVEIESQAALVPFTREIYQHCGSLISSVEILPELNCLKFKHCPWSEATSAVHRQTGTTR